MNSPKQHKYDADEFTIGPSLQLSGKYRDQHLPYRKSGNRKDHILEEIVVAPTGVAAINAGGITIHSFFQLPFGPYVPGSEMASGQNKSYSHKFNQDKINIIRSMDLLVIDEVSMVRADLLDAISDMLRRYRDRDKPFGGVQLLLIGDL